LRVTQPPARPATFVNLPFSYKAFDAITLHLWPLYINLNMKKIFALLLATGGFLFSTAQDTPAVDPQMDTLPPVIDTLPITDPNDLLDEAEDERRRKQKLNINQLKLANRSKDHLLVQVGFDGWSGMPDTINNSGLARSFNMYFMFDFPFKTNPRFSAAIGVGIGSNNMYFKDTYIDITGRDANRLGFQDVSDADHFKKYKLTTTFLEAPIELRYVANPERPGKSWKGAVGIKVGTMLSATTKGKNLLNSAGQNINSYTLKEKSKKYFNTTRFNATARVGYGNISLYGAYQINAFIKEGFGPDVRPFSIGITLSGL
jgi:hypothetical protein